jgi:hypothetical protein
VREPGRDRIAEAGAQTPVGAGVKPAAGEGRLDEAAREGDEVAPVADDDRVVVKLAQQLAIDAHRVDRRGLGLQQGNIRGRGGAGRAPQAGKPLHVADGARAARVREGGEEQGQVPGRGGRQRAVRRDAGRRVRHVHHGSGRVLRAE